MADALTQGDIDEGVGRPDADDISLSDDGPLLLPRNTIETINSEPPKKNRRKKRSAVWKEFKEIPGEKFPDGKDRAKCLRCGNVYQADTTINGTGALSKHLKKYHKQKNQDLGQMMLNSKEGKMGLREKKVDLLGLRERITRLVVKRELPLLFVEYEEFRDCISFTCPEYKHITRNTQMGDILRLYHSECARIKGLLKSYTGKISLTSDMWTSITTEGYISLIVHYIDNGWVLHKKLLKFSLMQPPHSGVNICDMVSKMLREWGIEKKLFSITLDNAAANMSFVELLKTNLKLQNALLCNGDFFHNRCCAHILNLIVQDGLKCIDESVSLVRSSILYVKASQSRRLKFLDCCKDLNLPTNRGLHADVPTRWNSTFHMLDSALFYRRAFESLQLKDKDYRTCCSDDQWFRIQKLTSFLKPFNEITVLLSGSKYPTANLYFFNVWKIHKNLLEELAIGPSWLKEMLVDMKKKFDKYWSEYSLILAIAMVFDPWYKLAFVEWAFKKIAVLDPNACDMLSRMRSALYRLFNEYKSMEENDFEITTSSCVGAPSELEEFLAFDNAMLVEGVGKSQLDMYLDEPKVPLVHENYHEFDILAYWKTNSTKYPEVARMARDVLAIPVSTVASESAFSTGGRVIDKYRSKLLPTNAEALICLRDWMFDIDLRSEPVDDSDEIANALGDVLANISLGSDSVPLAPTVDSSSVCSNA